MQTRTVPITALADMAEALQGDELVALPTETVYGLAARAGSREAVAKIFRVKGRPADNPLIVHCADAEQAFELARQVPDYARRLAEAFWPGPLTLVLPSAVSWPWVQAGHDTLAVRVPEPGYLRELIRRVGPLAAPSANLSGRPSPTTAAHCQADLAGAIPLIVDGGACHRGLESTVVDCTGATPAILRPGPVTAEMVRDATAQVGWEGRSASPGTRHPHYQPRARVVLVDDASKVRGDGAMTIGPRPGLAAHSRTYSSLDELARNLYAWFREADALGVEVVYVERVPEEGLGSALMNRLRKAADRED